MTDWLKPTADDHKKKAATCRAAHKIMKKRRDKIGAYESLYAALWHEMRQKEVKRKSPWDWGQP